MSTTSSSEEHWRAWIRQNPSYEGTPGAPVAEFVERIVNQFKG